MRMGAAIALRFAESTVDVIQQTGRDFPGPFLLPYRGLLGTYGDLETNALTLRIWERRRPGGGWQDVSVSRETA